MMEPDNNTRDWNELPLVGDFYETKIERIKNFLGPAYTYFTLLELVKQQPDNAELKELIEREAAVAHKYMGYVKKILDTI